MASPPSFSFSDDDEYSPHTAAGAPTPNGLNDRLLRFTHRPPPPQNHNHNPNPPAPEAEPREERKVKLAGRRRLCKVASSPSSSPDAADDEDSIRDILDDLTAGIDAMSVHNPRPQPRQPDPLPCALGGDEDDDGPEDAEDSYYDFAESPSPPSPHPESDRATSPVDDDEADTAVVRREAKVVDLSSSDDEAATAVVGRQVKVEKASDKGKKPAAGAYENREKVKREIKVEKPQVPAPAFASASADPGASSSSDFDREKAGDKGKKPAAGAYENREEKEDVGWEKTEDFKMELTGCGVMVKPYKLPGSIFKTLYTYQREGLKWLWVLHCRGTGGILGDDMGLGKTMQITAFLAGLFHSRLIKRVLVVVQNTLLDHWTKQLTAVGLKHKIREYTGTNVKWRDSELQYAFKEGGILLSTYGLVKSNYKLIRGDYYHGNVEAKYDKLMRGDHYDDADEDNSWDYVILDEAHTIKNPTSQVHKNLLEIPCVHRILITGTPIQNNLQEMWALFHFCCPEVLGDKDEFKANYESHINRGNNKNASDPEKHIGSIAAQRLREKIKPYFLRRMKSEVFGDTGSKKNELVVWLKLTTCQRKLYKAFLNSDMIHSGSPFASIEILKQICAHPILLTKRAAEGISEGMDEMLNDQAMAEKMAMDEMLNKKDMAMVKKMAMNLADMVYDDEALQVEEEMSCKLLFIKALLRRLLEEGHHVLIFCMRLKMLNLIQEVILLEGYKFLRFDGTFKPSERAGIVKDFQEGRAQIFLLAKQVGAFGLTLTKATRVIVVDPAWNPSLDNQCVDRAYRIGQTKDVIVYRLMTSGTIEEKIYKKQVFKGGLIRTATEQEEQIRYFDKKELQEVFCLPQQGFDVSLTQKQLQEEHGQQLVMDDPSREHIEYIEEQPEVAGVSYHSLLFSKTEEVLPALSEHDAVDSKPPSMPMMASRQYNKASSSDYVANGAAHAFKPKDFTPRAYDELVALHLRLDGGSHGTAAAGGSARSSGWMARLAPL